MDARHFYWWAGSARRNNRGCENWARSARKVTTWNLLQNVQYDPRNHEWPMPDILCGGVGLPDTPKVATPKIELDQLGRLPHHLTSPCRLVTWFLILPPWSGSYNNLDLSGSDESLFRSFGFKVLSSSWDELLEIYLAVLGLLGVRLPPASVRTTVQVSISLYKVSIFIVNTVCYLWLLVI